MNALHNEVTSCDLSGLSLLNYWAQSALKLIKLQNPVFIAAVLLALPAFSSIAQAAASAAPSEDDKTASPLANLLATEGNEKNNFGLVLGNPDKYRVQIVYTQIDRDANNKSSFRTTTYRTDNNDYFYPASTVKLPVAALALQKLKQLDIDGLDLNTTMLTRSAADYQTAAITDPTAPNGLPTVANYARKILLVSDNDAFNRLYEFVGQQDINEALHAMGYGQTRIVHRLEIGLSKDQNSWTNPIDFMLGDTLIYRQHDQQATADYYGKTPELLGVAEMVDGEKLNRPKDFSEKNAYPLIDQHNVVKSLMFPNDVPLVQRFDLSESDYRFLHKFMSMYPDESDISDYQDRAVYPPGYVKFLMFGGQSARIPDHIRVFNKVGDAYGFLTDSAYIVDFKNKIEFLLSASIFTNENLTFNDDNYEYELIGLPFLEGLGQAIYTLELRRARAFAPDLSELGQINY